MSVASVPACLCGIYQSIIRSVNQSFDRSINIASRAKRYETHERKAKRTIRTLCHCAYVIVPLMSVASVPACLCGIYQSIIRSVNQSFDRSINIASRAKRYETHERKAKRTIRTLCHCTYVIVPPTSVASVPACICCIYQSIIRSVNLYQSIIRSVDQSLDRSIRLHISKYVRIPQHEGGPGVRSINRSINRSIGRPINQTAHIQIRPDTTA